MPRSRRRRCQAARTAGSMRTSPSLMAMTSAWSKAASSISLRAARIHGSKRVPPPKNCVAHAIRSWGLAWPRGKRKSRSSCGVPPKWQDGQVAPLLAGDRQQRQRHRLGPALLGARPSSRCVDGEDDRPLALGLVADAARTGAAAARRAGEEEVLRRRVAEQRQLGRQDVGQVVAGGDRRHLVGRVDDARGLDLMGDAASAGRPGRRSAGASATGRPAGRARASPRATAAGRPPPGPAPTP